MSHQRAEHRAASAPHCATCDTLGAPADNFCGLCGSPFGKPAPFATRPTPIRPEPATTPAVPRATIATYSVTNQRRIFDACPHATEVRTFHGWLAARRCHHDHRSSAPTASRSPVHRGRT
jgi:hypothetical protein